MARRIWRNTRDQGALDATPPSDAERAGGDGLSEPEWHEAQAGDQARIPNWLQRAAGWSWRLLLIGILLYAAFRVASILRLVILPCVAALLLTALLQPLTLRLRRVGLPALAATWCTLLAALAVLAGATTLAVTQTSSNYPALVTDIGNTTDKLQRSLAGPPPPAAPRRRRPRSACPSSAASRRTRRPAPRR